MRKLHNLWAVGLLMMTLGTGWSQEPSDTGQPAAVPAPPDQGQGNAAPTVDQNPPLSALDEPGLEPRPTPESFFLPAAHVSEAIDSNVNDSLGGSAVHSVTRALGSLTLQKLWSSYEFAVNYVGGVGYYNVPGVGVQQIQQLDADQRINWKRGQLAIRDSFSYLPEGSFGFGAFGGGGAYGLGMGSLGQGLLGGGAFGGRGVFFGPGQFGSLGQAPRIMNLTLADVVENLTPRSSVTFAGGYGLVHFTQDDSGFLNSDQVSAQAGYDRQLTARDQVALVYGFQGFRFPGEGESFNTHIVNVLYGHRITGRLDVVVGGGPQITDITTAGVGDRRLSASGRASLRYRFTKTSLSVSYDRYNTTGSGFFAGAESDIVRFTAARPLGRVWNVYADLGYTHNSRIGPGLAALIGGAGHYNYGYAGLGVHRMLGRSFGVFMSYQFNDLAFDQGFCTPPVPCERISQRHVAIFGLDWHPHPIRLD